MYGWTGAVNRSRRHARSAGPRPRGRVRPDRLGTRTGGAEPPVRLWCLDELARRTALALARPAAADLAFVGRSLDSAYGLLTGAHEDTSRC